MERLLCDRHFAMQHQSVIVYMRGGRSLAIPCRWPVAIVSFGRRSSFNLSRLWLLALRDEPAIFCISLSLSLSMTISPILDSYVRPNISERLPHAAHQSLTSDRYLIKLYHRLFSASSFFSFGFSSPHNRPARYHPASQRAALTQGYLSFLRHSW